MLTSVQLFTSLIENGKDSNKNKLQTGQGDLLSRCSTLLPDSSVKCPSRSVFINKLACVNGQWLDKSWKFNLVSARRWIKVEYRTIVGALQVKKDKDCWLSIFCRPSSVKLNLLNLVTVFFCRLLEPGKKNRGRSWETFLHECRLPRSSKKERKRKTEIGV